MEIYTKLGSFGRRRRRPCEDGGRGWNYASKSQGTPGRSLQELGDLREDFPLEPSEGEQGLNALMWDFRPRNCETITFSHFLNSSGYGPLLWQPDHKRLVKLGPNGRPSSGDLVRKGTRSGRNNRFRGV